MNRMLTTVIAVGAGMAAYNLAQRSNMMNGRQMKRMRKRISRALM